MEDGCIFIPKSFCERTKSMNKKEVLHHRQVSPIAGDICHIKRFG
ncbi:hypothetical protein GCHA_0306 [Paraglaciecola chathamensis S18K6]|uniref:Uncharacterized protein n=1 Tax=Paraglaciecola chathamensis S18K6 TaxID=1127672 RepID=A0AAV3UT97_9ALTE|nr:hypothetical protein GCHA_0306 [Paraglaciecola chathamensis S18K6]